MTRSRVKLRRLVFSVTYDADGDQALYSAPFILDDEQEIVGVDWSVPGEVEVTYLVPDAPTPPSV